MSLIFDEAITGGGGREVKKYGADIDCILGNVTNGTLNSPDKEFSVSFPGVKRITSYSLYGKFSQTNCVSADFSDVERIDFKGLSNTFHLSSLTSIRFDNLKVIYNRGLESCFSRTKITRIDFPKVTSIGEYAFSWCMQSLSCEIYFNSLKEINNAAFATFMSNVTACTVHFPSNMEETIAGLQGYPLFGGTEGHVTLAFDLEAV